MNGQGRQGLESCVDVRGFGRHKPFRKGGKMLRREATRIGAASGARDVRVCRSCCGRQRFSVVRTGSASPSADKYAGLFYGGSSQGAGKPDGVTSTDQIGGGDDLDM